MDFFRSWIKICGLISMTFSMIFIISIFSGCSIKPTPFVAQDHLKRIDDDRNKLYGGQESLTEPLTLSMAIARALKYNFDNRLAMMESVLQDKQMDLATLEMLPKLIAGAGYSWRDNTMASFSVPVENPNNTSGYFTTSQDRERIIEDLTFSWNILDLGASYYGAKQQSDRILIAKEKQRSVINNIIRQVNDAFHNAVTSERLLPKVESCLLDANEALEMNHKIEEERLKPLVKVLQYRKDLLKLIDQLNQLHHNLIVSKTRLAALINLPLNENYSINFNEEPAFEPPEIKHSIRDLETLGLYYRHDIREEAYKARINELQIKKEFIGLFPGLSFSASANHDSNSFLMNNNWLDLGVETSFKLFNLIKGPRRLAVAKTRVMVDETRRLALSVASLVKINIAFQKYKQTMESYRTNSLLLQVEKHLQKAISNVTSLKAGSDLENIRQNASTIATLMNRDYAYTGALAALFELYASIGIDFYDGPVDDISLTQLMSEIDHRLSDWQTATLPGIPDVSPDELTNALSQKE